MQGKPTTLKDIARAAGVSSTAASFFINGRAREHRLSSETCLRIERAIGQLGYVANHHARAMAARRTFLIGLIVAGIDESFWPAIIAGVEAVVEPAGCRVLLGTSTYDPQREKDLFVFMARAGVDGIIYAPGMGVEPGSPAIEMAIDVAAQRPVVALTHPVKGLVTVWNDQDEGGRLAAQRFLDNGHKRIAYIGSLKKFVRRGRSFLHELAKNRIEAAGFADVDQFLARAREFTAVFCHTDYLAAELYAKAPRANLRIPHDLSVIGYDDMDFLRHLHPQPISVHQHKRELGEAAAKAILAMIDGNKPAPEEERRFLPYLSPGKSVMPSRS